MVDAMVDTPRERDDTDPPWSISTDGTTVWVNGPNGMLGRFGRRGIDVHSVDNTYCVVCTTKPSDLAAWGRFTREMYDVHHVFLDESYRPQWLFDRLAKPPTVNATRGSAWGELDDRIAALEAWRLRSDKRMSSIANTVTQLQLEEGELTELEDRLRVLEQRLDEHGHHWDLQVNTNGRYERRLDDLEERGRRITEAFRQAGR